MHANLNLRPGIGIRSVACLVVLTAWVATADAGVIAHWRFEDGSAGTSPGLISDSSANNLHLSPYNASGQRYTNVPNPGSTLGMEYFGTALAHRTGLTNQVFPDLTLEAYIRYDGVVRPGDLHQILFMGNSLGGRDPFYLAVYNGQLRFNISDGVNERILDTGHPIQIGEFMHVAATLDSNTDLMKVFVNGVEVGSLASNGISSNAAQAGARVSIGGLYDGIGRGQYFDGVIDEVRISNEVLAPSEFLNAERGEVPEPGTIAAFGIGGLLSLVRRRRNARR